MSFHDVRLPDFVDRGLGFWPQFNVTVIVTGGGFEQRNVNWSQARRRGGIDIKAFSEAELAEFLAFFIARGGRAFGFRYRDPIDHVMAEQSIGTGDGNETGFQLRKLYLSGPTSVLRDLTRPRAGTVAAFLDGAPQVEGADYTVDYGTGILDFAVAPGAGVDVRASSEFDTPVRFDADWPSASILTLARGDWSVEIVELRQ